MNAPVATPTTLHYKIAIIGTGFAASDPQPGNVLFDRDGIDPLDGWPADPRAYTGTMARGLPNLL